MAHALLTHQLPYDEDSSVLFARLSAEPWALFLDSGQPRSQYGRYDIFVAEPFITIKTQEALDLNERENTGAGTSKIITEIWQNGQTTISDEDPFLILNKLIKPYQQAYIEQGYTTKATIPFTGGAMGYFGYDLGRQIENLPNIAQVNPAVPHMMVGIYDWAVVVDHRTKTTMLVSSGLQEETRDNWTAICQRFDAVYADHVEDNFMVSTEVGSNMDYEQYSTAFNKIKAYIKAGDCYQVNLAQRFSAQAKGNAWLAYQKLREVSSAPFMAYMNFGDLQVLSGSPERFLQIVDGHVETRPIKGTRPRHADEAIDASYAAELQASVKDRAENLMIVDLLRNDISKNCATGSVKADKLFQLQSFANVHHLVSIVTGTLAKGKTAIDLLRGAFPGGSITGAPKLRSMEIIEELEPHRRGVYCGSVGYIGFDGNMDTNITIRTAVFSEGEVSFYAGGGIVADSELAKEYEETRDKASSIMKVMRFFQ
jgi:para-aminobenzoate synthetase component 1